MIAFVSWSEEYSGLRYDSAYLINMYSIRKGSGGLAPLKFYDNKEFKGEPVMVLDEKGLKIKGKLECKWDIQFPNDTMLVKHQEGSNSDKICPRQGPIVSEEDSPVLIEVKDNLSDGYYETAKYEDKVLYINKKETESYDYRDSKYAIKNAEIAKNKSAYEELKKTDKSLVEFLDKWNKCVEKKDEKCLTKDRIKSSLIDAWVDYACYKVRGFATESFCQKWLDYQCQFSGELSNKGRCSMINYSKVKPSISETTRFEVNEIIWNALASCFLEINLKNNQLNVEKSQSLTTVSIRTQGNRTYVCRIYKKNTEGKKDPWKLGGVSDYTDEMIEGGVYEIF